MHRTTKHSYSDHIRQQQYKLVLTTHRELMSRPQMTITFALKTHSTKGVNQDQSPLQH
jgi:hypothetical protein